MALFPKCSFSVLVPNGVIVPGTRVDGTLVIDAPEPIPRAEHVDLVFRSVAWAGYGAGKQRTVYRRTMFEAPLRVDLTQAPMPAGRHSFPFAIEVPPWLPPGYAGKDCAIEHVIEMRVDVDWAIDPVAKLIPIVASPLTHGSRKPVTTRSPAGFHDSIVLEVTLPTSVISQAEPLSGHIALRSGHTARFDAVELAMVGSATMVMARGDSRRGWGTTIRIPAEALRSGEAVPFQFPPFQRFPPTFRSAFIDHDVILAVKADVPWATDPSFAVMLHVLPEGSPIVGDTAGSVVGSERLRLIAAAMAEATGLREGRAPALVEGSEAGGAVAIRVSDAPRSGSLGIDVDITYPGVELGIAFRRLGMLEGFRTSPLLPPALRDTYLLRCDPEDHRPPTHEMVVAQLVGTLLAGLEGAEDVRFSDHHLGAHIPIPNDELPRMLDIARAARAKAKTVVEAITALPFPASLAAAAPAWRATASEQNAFLVPTGPSLHGVTFRARVLAGEERTITAAFRTKWTKEGPTTHVDVDLRAAPIPKAAWDELESESPGERVRAVRALFPSAHVVAEGTAATLDRPEFTVDPRSLLSAIETFFDWVLEARGERRGELPYR
jgi:hypothetical protein